MSEPGMDVPFECTQLAFDATSGAVELGYRCGPETFVERITLPATDRPTESLWPVLRLLHVVAGVSYFKSIAPTTLRCPHPLTDAERVFVEAVYRSGLREFAYVNDLPHVLHTQLEAPRADSHSLEWPDGPPLVPCGGGKDSIVSAELLRRDGRDPVSFAVNPNQIIRDVVAASELPLLAAQRALDPRLFELNDAGALNGHIPVTAINSLIAVATAAWHGLGPVVMSNESSASSPNLEWHGVEVNHQWSKSIEAESLLQAALASRFGERPRYFSMLRQLNEIQIAALFATTDRYDDAVTSCNRAFTILRSSGRRWCRDCPKCRFVFLAMAPFMPPERIEHIFGGSPLADPAQLEGYRALLGIGAYKPFECVGEVDESFATVLHLADDDYWRSQPIVRALLADIAADGRPVPSWPAVVTQRARTLAPPDYVDLVDRATGSVHAGR